MDARDKYQDLSEGASRRILQLQIERRGEVLFCQSGAFAALAGALISMGSRYKAMGARLALQQQTGIQNFSLRGKSITEQLYNFQTKIIELKRQIQALEKFIQPVCEIQGDVGEKPGVIMDQIDSSIQSHELTIFGARIILLGGFAQAIAGLLLIISQYKDMNSGEMAIANKSALYSEVDEERQSGINRQVEDLLIQVQNLRNQIGFIERNMPAHFGCGGS